jgi:hypothetical protein
VPSLATICCACKYASSHLASANTTRVASSHATSANPRGEWHTTEFATSKDVDLSIYLLKETGEIPFDATLLFPVQQSRCCELVWKSLFQTVSSPLHTNRTSKRDPFEENFHQFHIKVIYILLNSTHSSGYWPNVIPGKNHVIDPYPVYSYAVVFVHHYGQCID